MSSTRARASRSPDRVGQPTRQRRSTYWLRARTAALLQQPSRAGGLRTSALLTRTRMCAKCLSRRGDPPYRPPDTAAMRGSQMSDYNVSFRSVLRGYDQEQVDQHMRELAQAAAKSWQEATEHTR